MNVYAWVLLAALAIAAGGSWAASAWRRPDVEVVTRPVVALLLLALAWLLRADTVGYGRLLMAGLVLGFVADAMAGSDRWSRWQPAARFASRGLYLVAVALLPPGDGPAWPGVLLMLLAAGVLVWRRVVPPMRERWPDGAPLLGYAVLVASVPLAAWWSGHEVVGWGATLLAAGDTLRAYDRHERPVPGAGVAVVVMRDVAALLLVLGMLRA